MARLGIIATVLLVAGSSFATTIHVPTEQPTIQAGIDAAQNGDTVLVAPGTYVQNLHFNGKSLSLISESGAQVTTIRPATNSYPTIRCVDAPGINPTVAVIGFTFDTGTHTQIEVFNGANATIKHNIFHNVGGRSIFLYHNSNAHVERNLFHHNGTISADFLGSSTGAVINNTFDANTRALTCSTDKTVTVRNNIITNNTEYGVYGVAAQLDYNDIWSNATNFTNGASPGPHDISLNPEYVDASNSNYFLAPSSSCIDAGDPDPKYNEPNGSRSDMGAFGSDQAHSTIHVPADQPTIQAGIDVALDGDTVLVADGLYNERISFLGKKITVSSQYLIDGDSLHIYNTVIDGGASFITGEDTTSVLCGVTLQNRGAYIGEGLPGPRIEHCRFLGNGISMSAPPNDGVSSLLLLYCHLIDCGISNTGNARATIRNCEIDGWAGSYGFRPTIDSSQIGGVTCTGGGGNLITSSVISGSLIAWFGGVQVRQCSVGRVRVMDVEGMMTLDSCVIGVVEEFPLNPGILIEARNCLVKDTIYFRNTAKRFVQSTILGPIVQRPYSSYPARFAEQLPDHRAVTLDSCIVDVSRDSTAGQEIYDNAIKGDSVNGDIWRVHVHCSNIFGYRNSWLSGKPTLIDTSDVTFLDPLFCDPASGDYSLRNSSPCTAANNICGVQIGAFGVGCENIAPEITSPDLASVNEDDQFVYRGTATDPDGPSLAFSFMDRPSWLTSDADSIFGAPHYGYMDTSFVVIASDGFLADSLTVTVRINQLTPEVHVLRVDSDTLNLHVISASPQIKWHYFDPTGNSPQTEFEIAVDTDTNWTHIEMWNPGPFISTDSSVLYNGSPLGWGQTYYLRLRANNGSRWSPWKYGSFHMNSLPSVPVAVYPPNGEEIKPSDWLIWEESFDADTDDTVSYTLQIDNNSDFSSPEVTESGITDFPEKTPPPTAASAVVGIMVQDLTDVGNLVDGTVYFWRVKAVDKFGGESAFTDGTSFFSYNSINSAPLPPTSGFSPTADAVMDDLTPTISWHPGTDPDVSDNSSVLHYNLRLDDDGEIEADYAFQYSTIQGVESFEVTAPLATGTHWYYAVQTVDDEGLQSGWSVVQSFWTSTQIVTAFTVNGASNLDHVTANQPVLAWEYFDDYGFTQAAFEVQVGNDDEWSVAELWNSGLIMSGNTQVNYSGQSLVDGQTYYLRLRLSDGSFWEPWYSTSFRMNSLPSVPAVAWPHNAATTDYQPTLYVANGTDPESDPLAYQFEVYLDFINEGPIAVSGLIPETPDSTGWTGETYLTENVIHFWRCRAWDGFEYSNWSPYWFFAIDYFPEPPGTPALVSPVEDNLILYDMLPTFSWSGVTDPDPFDEVHYRLELSFNSNFTLVVPFDGLTQPSYQLADSLLFGTHYWWRVKAFDLGGLFSVSDTADFWSWTLGDVNRSHSCSISDIVLIVDHLFINKTPIVPLKTGDVNHTCSITISDVSLIVNHLFVSGAKLQVGCE